MNSWHSFPSIYALGHRYVADILTVDVNCEEKVDGSQFSFGTPDNQELLLRSKGAIMYPAAPEKMFTKAAETAIALLPDLHPGWTYRAEYLSKPKHNTLCYNRVPNKYLILFDVNTGEESYLNYEEKAAEAARLGLEVVPLIFTGRVTSLEQFKGFLERESILGGVKVEGVVIKPKDYNLFGMDKKCLMAKFVSEAFKEVHGKEWKKSNPGHGDVIENLAAIYKTEARWQKAIQHLRDAGQLTDSPKDIGPLLKEIGQDVHKECADEIKEALFKWAWPHLQRKVIAGCAEWYKEQLAARQFAGMGQ